MKIKIKLNRSEFEHFADIINVIDCTLEVRTINDILLKLNLKEILISMIQRKIITSKLITVYLTENQYFFIRDFYNKNQQAFTNQYTSILFIKIFMTGDKFLISKFRENNPWRM